MTRRSYHHHGESRWDSDSVVQGIRFYHGVDHDLESSPADPPRDEHLRELVDSLPAQERHMVERVHFASATLAVASEELGVSRSSGARILREALERLKGWLEGGVTPEPEEEVFIVRHDPAGTTFTVARELAGENRTLDSVIAPECNPCTFEHPDWGRCRRPERDDGLCASHLFWLRTGVVPNEDYHRAIVQGRRGVQEFLSDAEMEALVNGRYRGDGRRLDQFITHDPLGFMPWPGQEEE